MLAALRELIQRWVGMTAEVQTMEPADTTLPGATPTCSADYTASASTRRPKRTAGSSTTEAAELKRPRTAPSTPIDPSLCGPGAAGSKHTAFDADDSRLAPAGPLHDNTAATRPTATVSAPAALTRSMRSQPAASTAATATPSSTSGPHAGGGGAVRHGAAASGSTAVSGIAPPPPLPEARDAHPQTQHPHHHHHHHSQSAGENIPAVGGGGGGGGASSRGSSGSRHHTPHAADAHQHALTLAHHRHDALEEQVFSPGFHLPSSSPSSPAASHGGAAPSPSPAPSPASGPDSGGGGGDMAPSHRTPQRGDHVAPVPQPQQQPQQQLVHAIDLNVVEGVEVDSEDDELRGGAAAAAAATAAATAGIQAGAEAGSKGVAVPAAAEGVVAADGDCSVAAAITSTHPGKAHDEGYDEEEEFEVEDEDEDGYNAGDNDENAPAGWAVAATTTAAPPAAASQRPHLRPRNQQQLQQLGDQAGQGHGQGQPSDQVLVASAPRALAAAVSTAMQHQQQQQSAGGGGEAGGQQAEGEQDEDEEDDEEEEEEAFLEFDPLLFIKQLPPLESCVPPHRPALLPPMPCGFPPRSSLHPNPGTATGGAGGGGTNSNSVLSSGAAGGAVSSGAGGAGAGDGGSKRLPPKPLKTLVLDLDETLVHSSLEAVERSDFNFPVLFNGMEHTVYVRQRPHLRDFMVRVSALFEVVVFTASQRIYAERLLDILDPGAALVRHRIYRDSCVVVDGNYLKDLSVLGRDLAHTVIVDNSPQAFGFQVDNGIPIESWYDDEGDVELLKLLPFLEGLAAEEVADVRPRIRAQFRLRELIDRA